MSDDTGATASGEIPEPAAAPVRRGKRLDPIPPQARPFQGLRAGVVSRTVAGGIDYTLVIVTTLGSYVAVAVLLFLINPKNYQLPTWSFAEFLLIGFGLFVSYLTIAFATGGRTLGAAVMGLRVVGRKGRRLRWTTSFLRACFCAVFPIGLFWSAVSRQNRSVQDMVLRTSVIHDWPHRRDVPALSEGDVEARRLTT